MPAARLSNARLRKGEPYGHDASLHVASATDTMARIAATHGTTVQTSTL